MSVHMIGDQPFAYEESGAGSPALVFVHGLCCAGGDWDHQRKAFESTHRIVSVDQRGHGDSTFAGSVPTVETSAADVVALIEELSAFPAVLVGHSLGCRVVIEAAVTRPDLVAGVVFVDGSRLNDPGETDARTRAETLIADKGGISSMVGAVFDVMFTDRTAPSVRELIVSRALAVPGPVAHSLFVSGFVYDEESMQTALQNLSCPLHVIQSTTFTPKTGRRPLQEGESSDWLDFVAENARYASIDVLPDIGHFTMIDAPDETNHSLRGFLERISRGG